MDTVGPQDRRLVMQVSRQNEKQSKRKSLI